MPNVRLDARSTRARPGHEKTPGVNPGLFVYADSGDYRSIVRLLSGAYCVASSSNYR
jgi:hypothetical protein